MSADPPLDSLERVRASIEQLDQRIIDLIGERVELSRQVGTLKRSAGLPTLDPAREATVLRRVASQARAAQLPDEPVREIFWHVIALCRAAQTGDA
jgi:chorismate mutase